jgi:hypothetical protein
VVEKLEDVRSSAGGKLIRNQVTLEGLVIPTIFSYFRSAFSCFSSQLQLHDFEDVKIGKYEIKAASLKIKAWRPYARSGVSY